MSVLGIGLPGPSLCRDARAWLRHPAVGAVVLFQRNLQDHAQQRALIAEIRACAPSLLLAVDQEGGRVQRCHAGLQRLPALGAIGAVADRDAALAERLAEAHALLMAWQIRELGFDLSFAPVLDLDAGSRVIGDRAFGADPQRVLELGRAYLRGMRRGGLATVGKHFPGHGSVLADTHHEIARDQRSLEQIMACDLRPFAGLADGSLDAVMMAHVVYPAVDPLPAGHSRIWIADVLRERLGFRGVVISDDVGMAAAAVLGDVGARVRAHLSAGCDTVLVCDPDQVESALDAAQVEPGDRPWSPLRARALADTPPWQAAQLLLQQELGCETS